MPIEPKAAQPIDQEIASIEIGGDEIGYFSVGSSCDKIEQIWREGEYCLIPYVRVWNNGQCIAEINWHKLNGVYYA